MAYNWIFEILKWLIVLLYVSFLGYPVCFRFLRFLPSRGFSFSLPVGFIIIGYLYWILCSLGLISNDSGGIITVLVFGRLSQHIIGRSICRKFDPGID